MQLPATEYVASLAGFASAVLPRLAGVCLPPNSVREEALHRQLAPLYPVVMRLRKIGLHSYRQFIDQRLELPGDVTVLVGRNDAGKTGILVRLIDQHFFERVIHGSDKPGVIGAEHSAISFDTTWEVSPADYDQFSLSAAFHQEGIRTLETQFREGSPTPWQYFVNGERVEDAYVTESGRTFLRSELDHYRLFPHPHYLNVGDQTGVTPDRLLVSTQFEAQFLDPSSHHVPFLREHLHLTPESLLLRLAGFRARTRSVGGRGIEEPWGSGRPYRSPVSAGDVQRGLDLVATRITAALQRWWKDPEGLSFRLRISNDPHCHDINSFLIHYAVADHTGFDLYGSGLRWFISFLIQILYIDDAPKPLLLMIDEPATPLHPGAQRALVQLLNTLSGRHQLIYTTHSPFMLDWNFPQRIRVLERDPITRRTQIVNRPYVSSGPAGKLWEPLRASIGTTMGGIATIGERTYLVEGISDQILLANMSAHLERLGRTHLNLEDASIVPYSEEISLKQLIRAVRSHQARGVVLVDTDAQRVKAEHLCRKENFPVVQAGTFAGRSVGAIEDVIGIEDYIPIVNEFYQQFPWYSEIETDVVRRDIGNRTLGKYLEEYFGRQFQQTFNKVSVAIALAYAPERLTANTMTRVEQLMDTLVAAAS